MNPVLGMDVKDIKGRLRAAADILSKPSLTTDSLESLRTLLKGINPAIDNALTEVAKHMWTFENIQQGAVVDLAAHAMPEITEEDKKRKKAFILLLRYWNDLKSEVARVQAEMNSSKSQGQGSHTSVWWRIFKGARGPLAVVTIVAIGVAALAATSVNIVITNEGCGTLYANSKVPVSIPGLVLPSKPIASGDHATVTIPPLSVTIDGTAAGKLTLSSLKLNFSIQLSDSVTNVEFDGTKLLGAKTDVDLSKLDSHSLRIICK